MVNISRIQPNGQFDSNSTVHGGPGTCKVLSDDFSLLVVIIMIWRRVLGVYNTWNISWSSCCLCQCWYDADLHLMFSMFLLLCFLFPLSFLISPFQRECTFAEAEGFSFCDLFRPFYRLIPPSKIFLFWMKMRQCVRDECLYAYIMHIYVACQIMVWHKEMVWRWMCHRKASHILWMNHECRELSIIYNATSTLTPKGQPLVWLGSLQYVLRTWQRHIHM